MGNAPAALPQSLPGVCWGLQSLSSPSCPGGGAGVHLLVAVICIFLMRITFSGVRCLIWIFSFVKCLLGGACRQSCLDHGPGDSVLLSRLPGGLDQCGAFLLHHKQCEILSQAFSVAVDMSTWFSFLYFLNVVNYIAF